MAGHASIPQTGSTIMEMGVIITEIRVGNAPMSIEMLGSGSQMTIAVPVIYFMLQNCWATSQF